MPIHELPQRAVRDGPRIAMVTPALESGRFLEATLRSVLDQGYPKLEYFVQDGGSKDETRGILERYGERLTGWVSEPDEGQADAIARGFERVRGDVMAWLNADDLLLPGTLHYVAAFFRDHPEADVVYGHRIIIDEDGREIGRWVLPRHSAGALVWRDYIPQETLFWRRRIWERAGGVDPAFRFAMDWDTLARFHVEGARFVRLPRFLAAFRSHRTQKSLTARRDVGEAEFAIIRDRVGPNAARRLQHRLASLRYLVTSFGYAWIHRAGLLRFQERFDP